MTSSIPAATSGDRPNMQQRAIELAELGYKVFRLEPRGKTPVDKNFPQLATSDPAVVRSLWSDAFGAPTDHNIGVLTGRGLVAVDYDVKDGRPGLAYRDEYDAKGMPRSIRVDTPTGGQHLLLAIPDQLVIGSSVQKLAQGVDTRGRNSYVVGPGSVVDTPSGPAEYRFATDARRASDAAPVPTWFMDLLLKHSRYRDSPAETRPLVDLDEPMSIDAAIRYLTHQAPSAIEGDGGDHTTFAVAARLRELGVSEDFALDLMLEHWNEQKASPPWDRDELATKVRNAYRYAQEQPGAGSPLAEFEHVEVANNTAAALAAQTPSDPDWPRPTPLAPFDPADLPAREFVFRQFVARQNVTALVAPSGAGKTQLLIQAALSLATKRRTTPLSPIRKAKVWLWNQEDPIDELRRRFAASLDAFNIDMHATAGRLFFDSGVEKPLKLAQRNRSGALVPSPHVDQIIRRIRQHQIDAFIADPLVEFHDADENNNVEMAFVAAQLRRIAVEGNCAVLIGHHDRKPADAGSTGHAGQQHAMRGASSLQGVTRSILTLYAMSDADAKEWGIAKEERHLWLRLDGAKNNLGLTGGEPLWMKRTGVELTLRGTVGGEVGAVVDEVGVLVPTERPSGGRVVFENDADTLVVRALEMCAGEGMTWTPWQVVLDVLADEARWPRQERFSERSWKGWMASVSHENKFVEIRKGNSRKDGILIRKMAAKFLD